MALTHCRECNHAVATDARACPNCGLPHPAQSEAAAATSKVFRGVVFFAAIVALLLWMTVSGWFG